MALINFPNKIPSKQKFYLESNSQTQESLFTRKKTVYSLSGSRWLGRFTYDVIDDEEYESLMNFIYQCRGQFNSFKVGDFLRNSPTVDFSAVRLANSATLALTTESDIPNYVTVNNRLKKVISTPHQSYVDCDDCIPDGYLRHSLANNDNEKIVVVEPLIEGLTVGTLQSSLVDFSGEGVFRLVDDKQGSNFYFDGNIGNGYLLIEEVV